MVRISSTKRATISSHFASARIFLTATVRPMSWSAATITSPAPPSPSARRVSKRLRASCTRVGRSPSISTRGSTVVRTLPTSDAAPPDAVRMVRAGSGNAMVAAWVSRPTVLA